MKNERKLDDKDLEKVTGGIGYVAGDVTNGGVPNGMPIQEITNVGNTADGTPTGDDNTYVGGICGPNDGPHTTIYQ